MSDKASKNSPGMRLWRLFASVKLSFVLLLLLALFSMAGTLIPQKEHPSAYLQHFGEAKGRLILSLGLDDLYHSPMFMFIMSALAANLVICSLERLPGALKIMRKDPAKDLGRSLKPAQSLTLTEPLKEAAGRAEGLLKDRMGRVYRAENEGGLVLLAQRGAFSRMGVFVVHASVLIIFAGAMLGNIWGFTGNVNIDQGQSAREFILESGRPQGMGFTLRLDKFTVSYYKSGMISEYRSDVTFVKNGRAVKKAVIRVNEPAEFAGIDFYQSTWGRAYPFRMIAKNLDKKINLKPRQWVDLPAGGRVLLMDFHENVKMGAKYKGPVARLAYAAKGAEPKVIFAFKAGSKMPGRGPYKFEIAEGAALHYSGLQVRYDPGVWVVWIGCGLMVVGFFWAFYLSHKKIWIRLNPAPKGGVLVQIAGTANKNRPALKRVMLKLAQEMQAQDTQKTPEK